MMMRSVLIVALALGLAACGRKGMPEWPEDAVYPRDYPYTPLPSETKRKTPDSNTKAGY
jgi:predicted small lipoprotein YifL